MTRTDTQKPRVCKVCPPRPKPLPAPYPGPRCHKHHHEKRREDRKRAAENREAKLYGLEPGDYETVLEVQGGTCPICLRAKGSERKRLAKDHDHRSGLFRGLLCSNCNDLLGDARDDIAFFYRAILYLLNPPAAFLQRYAPLPEVKR